MRVATLRELNVVKKDFRKVKVKFALCYPSTYRAGMSSLALHLIYGLINEQPGALCERFFYDRNLPRVLSVESRTGLKDFSIIGFSFQYELDYVNALSMLIASGIPVRSSDRMGEHPLIIAGGPAVSSNPFPLFDFIDAFIIGEAEDLIPKIVEIVASYDSPRLSIEELSKLKGVFTPSVPQSKIVKAYIPDLNSSYYPTRQILPMCRDRALRPVFEDAFLLEVSRGCTKSCRFCLESFLYRPFRERGIEVIEQILTEGLRRTPAGRVVCIGSAFSSHSRFDDLLEIFHRSNVRLSIPSVWPNAVNELLMKLLASSGQRTLTMAPESISFSLQRAINKNFLEDAFIEAAKLARKHGLKQIKLYFMLGIPGERDEDVVAIADFVNKLVDLGFNTKNAIRISVNPLIPKAWTPFQWADLINEEVYRRRCAQLAKRVRKPQVSFSFFSFKWAKVQALLSLGGRSLSSVLETVAVEGNTLSAWKMALSKGQLDVHELLAEAKLSRPWGAIDLGVNEGFLKKEFEKAIQQM